MRRAEDHIRKLAAVTGAVLLAAAEALAQENARPARRIVVSIPDHKLAVIESGEVVRVFSTAVGRAASPSPKGSYRIVVRIPEPTWYGHGRIVPPGKGNPLGTRWMGLSVKGYGIHGTNRPGSIGHNASHGCIRMRNRDVEKLFDMVSVGDPVDIYGERTGEVERIFGPVMLARHAAGMGQPAGGN